MVLHWRLLQHMWLKVWIWLLVPGSIHVHASVSPGDFFSYWCFILEHILLQNLRDLVKFEYRTIQKPCLALPNYHIWLSHQFQVAGTYSCRVTASKLSEILFQRVLGCNWYHKMGIPLWMGVQSVSSQGPRIVALHSQILFTLQVISNLSQKFRYFGSYILWEFVNFLCTQFFLKYLSGLENCELQCGIPRTRATLYWFFLGEDLKFYW